MDNRPRTETRGVEITVGRDGGELRGRDDRALQAAIDYVDRLGGGTVIVLAGRYEMCLNRKQPRDLLLLGRVRRSGGTLHVFGQP